MTAHADRRLQHREQYSHLTPTDLLRNGIETERLEVIRIGQIQTEHALVDELHAQELGASMRLKRGQLTPITVRARLAERRGVVYDVIDGFHRTEGKRQNGEPDINATVVYGCPDEEMYDLRILAASSVRSVQFARIAQWITSSYATTPWADKGISVTQAFSIAHTDSKNTTLSNEMSQDDVTELKNWVKTKCDRWGRPMGSVRIELQLVANSDPSLVRQVRNTSGGRESETTITQLKLGTVVKAFPGVENYPVQRAVLQFAINNKVKTPEIAAVAELLKEKVQPGIDESELPALIQQVYGEVPKLDSTPKVSARKTRRLLSRASEEAMRFSSPQNDASGLEGEDEPDIAEILAIEHALSKGEMPDDLPNIPKPSLVNLEEEGIEEDSPTLSTLRTRVKELETKLEIALHGSNEQPQLSLWWKDAPYLTPTERFCLAKGFYGKEDLDRVAGALKVPLVKVFEHMRNAFAKRNIAESLATGKASRSEAIPPRH